MKTLSLQNILCIILLISSVYSQNRVLLHINSDGIQDVIPIGNKKNTEEIISLSEHRKNAISYLGVMETLRYYDPRNEGFEIISNFGFNSQDVAFQWYYSPVELTIEELWWKNAINQGTSKKARVRAWRVNKSVFDLPIDAVNKSGRVGYYNSECDTCEIAITPFKPKPNSIFKRMNNSDSTNTYFDPLGEEWLPGDTTITLDSNKWQRLSLPSKYPGPYFSLREMEPFGFTIQNVTLPSQGNERMEIYSKEIKNIDTTLLFSPYHSMKFYNNPSSDSTIGWQIRNYEWGMYVVASVTTDGPYLVFDFIGKQNPLKSNIENKINVKIKNYGGPAQPTTIKEAFFKYKIGYSSVYNTILMNSSNDTFTVSIPPMPVGKQVFAYVVVNDIYRNRMHSNVIAYSTITDVNFSKQQGYSFALLQNYPNPFNPTTNIPYQLSSSGVVTLKVYDVLGREIATIVDEYQSAGNYSKQWDASKLTSGLYYYRLMADEYMQTKKLLLLK